MRVVFHIGTNKAGSTTIQETLARTSDQLLKDGYYYPYLGNQVSHTRLLFAICDDDEFLKHHGRWSDAPGSRLSSERLWEEMSATIAAHSPHTLILSSEFGIGLRRTSFERLLSRLRVWSDQVELALYYRSPASHFLSSVQQGMKFGSKVEDLFAHRAYRKGYKKAAGWNVEKLTVKVLDRKVLFKGCVCKDFLHSAVGMDEKRISRLTVHQSNESLSSEAMVLLQGFNRFHLGEKRRPGNPLSVAMVSAVQWVESKAQRKFTRPRLREELRYIIENEFNEELVWMRDNVGVTFADFPYENMHEETARMAAMRASHDRLQLSDVIAFEREKVVELRNAVFDRLVKERNAAGVPPKGDWTKLVWKLLSKLLRKRTRSGSRQKEKALKRRLLRKHRELVSNRLGLVDGSNGLGPEDLEDQIYFSAFKELLPRKRKDMLSSLRGSF